MSQRRLDYKHGLRHEATRWYIEQFIYNKAGVARFRDVRAYREDIDFEQVAVVIKSMPYRQFLQTLYWYAISEERKRKAGYRCALCGKVSPRLNVHHSTYEHHGMELQYRKQDLVCLCQDCHSRFHQIPL